MSLFIQEELKKLENKIACLNRMIMYMENSNTCEYNDKLYDQLEELCDKRESIRNL